MAPVQLAPLETQVELPVPGAEAPRLEDPVVRWVLDKARRVEDRRFASHGTTHAARRYEAFTEARDATAALREGDKLFNARVFYDTRSYDCRDVPSERPGTLRLIFEYYASLLTPNAVNTGLTDANAPLTLALIEVANNTISLTELATFASNYGLVPDMISHAGLHFAWQRQRRARSNEHPTELDYPAFVEVLARCALIAFPGDPKARIEQLVRFMDLKNTRKHVAMLEALEKTRQGKHRPTKNIRHAPVSLDDSRQSGDKNNPHGFHMVSARKKRWSKISVAADPASLFVSAPAQQGGGAGEGGGTSAPPSFEHDPQRRARKQFWLADDLWDPALLEILAPFEFENYRKKWLPFEGEHLDMGVLVQGSTHNFRIVVQNKCPFTTHVAMHFEDVPETELLVDPREMAVGLSREAIARIHCVHAGEHHGSICIRMLDSEDQVVQERRIPVYCNVVESSEDREAALVAGQSERPARARHAAHDEKLLGAQRKRSDEEVTRRVAQMRKAEEDLARARSPSPSVSGAMSRNRDGPFVGALLLPSPSRRILGDRETEAFERKPLPVSLTASPSSRSLHLRQGSPTSTLASRRANLHRAEAAAAAAAGRRTPGKETQSFSMPRSSQARISASRRSLSAAE